MKKFYSALVALLCAFTAGATDYYLIGGFNGWTLSAPTCKFTPAGNGNYVLDFQGTLISGFKLNDGTWSNDNANFGAGSGKLVIGTPYTLSVGGSSGNIQMDGNITNPHITFNPEARTLLIEGQAADVTYSYAIHGQIFGDTNWSSCDMEDVNGVWTLTADVVPGGFGIKQLDSSTGMQTDWYSSASGEVTITDSNLSSTFDVMVEGTNWNCQLTGEYTFKFDPKALTLKIEKFDGVTDIVADQSEAVYYNLQGIKVDEPQNGLYIEVRGNKVSKVIK